MDLSRAVFYRNFNLNQLTKQTNGPSSGCLLERVNYANVQGIGYTEKRSLGDGNDASDVFLSTRRIQLSGTLYGSSYAQLFDLKQTLVKTFSPTLAYRDSPYGYGYMPLSWQEPTLDPNFSGQSYVRNLYSLVRPLALPTFEVVRDTASDGATSGRGATMSWQVVVEAKDPRIYVSPEKKVEFSVGGTSDAGTWTNRGDYPAPLQVMLHWAVGPGQVYYWHFTGGGSIMTIKLPVPTSDYIIRYDGYLKVLTLQQGSNEYLRMDLLDFTAELTHPLIAPGPSDWSWTRNTMPGDGLLRSMQMTGPEEEEAEPDNPVTVHATPVPDGPTLLAASASQFWFYEAYS